MAHNSKGTHGYIKTENTILFVVMALLIGFIGGVLFSAYRYSGAATNMVGQNAPNQEIPQAKLEQLNLLNEQVKNNPADIEAWTRLGHIYFDTGQYDSAIAAYERSVELDGNRPDIWVDLGVMYRRSGKPDKAVEKFDTALKINPKHEIALFNKGIVMMHDLKDMKGATQAWSQLLMINPEARTPAGEPLSKMVDQLRSNMASEEKR